MDTIIKIFVGVMIILVAAGVAETVDMRTRIAQLEVKDLNNKELLIEVKKDVKWIRDNMVTK